MSCSPKVPKVLYAIAAIWQEASLQVILLREIQTSGQVNAMNNQCPASLILSLQCQECLTQFFCHQSHTELFCRWPSRRSSAPTSERESHSPARVFTPEPRCKEQRTRPLCICLRSEQARKRIELKADACEPSSIRNQCLLVLSNNEVAATLN